MADPRPTPADPANAPDRDGDIPEARTESARRYPALVWLVPIVAVLIGLSIVIQHWLSQGPEITITFRTADGIEPGQTRVRYKDVDIGKVTAVDFGEKKGTIVVTAQIARKAKPFLRQDSRFWVVRPQIGASGISGIGTLFSGTYISMAAGKSDEEAEHFKGLEVAPINDDDRPGRQYQLRADTVGSLDIGSPVMFRQIRVGRVVGYQVDKDGRGVVIQVFVDAPYDRFVGADTRFWQASGVNASYGAEGFHLGLESLASLVVGGLAFETPDDAPVTAPVVENTSFKLFGDRTQAMKRVFKQVHENILYFNQSLRGLAKGAPVEFRGLVIGEVLSFGLQYDRKRGKFRVPVKIATYPELINEALVANSDRPDADTEGGYQDLVNNLIATGIRAQLQSSGLITGTQFVALDYFPKAPPARIDWSQPIVELPTVPGGIDQLQNKLQDILDKIDNLPFDRLASQVSTNLDSLNKTVNNANRLVGQMNDEIAPQAKSAIAEAQKTIVEARKTLGSAQATLDSANGTIAEDSPLQNELRKTLKELTRSARAFADLSDYLERHPESIVRGKPDEPKKN